MIDAPSDSVDTALADARALVTNLRRYAQRQLADELEEIVQRLDRTTHDYRLFVPERDAMVRSGKSAEWFKARFPEWQRQGNARANPTNPRERQYRLCVVPVVADVEGARASARRAARGEE